MPSRKLKNLEGILRTGILKPPKDFNERMVPPDLKVALCRGKTEGKTSVRDDGGQNSGSDHGECGEADGVKR